MVRPLCSSTISETLFHDVLQVPLSKKPCSALAAREQGSFSQIPLWSYRPLPIVFLHREPRRLHRPRDRRTSDPYRKIPDGILTPFRLGIKGRFILSFLGDGIALFDFSSCTRLLDTAAYYRQSIQKVAKCPNWFRADQIEDDFLIAGPRDHWQLRVFGRTRRDFQLHLNPPLRHTLLVRTLRSASG